MVTRARAPRQPGARGTFSVYGPLCSYLNGELYEGLYARLYNKVLSPTGADDYVKIESDDNDYIRRGSFGVSFWFT